MGRQMEFPEKWIKLAKACGGRDKLAKKLGVDGRTISRWANEETRANRFAREAVNALAVSLELDPPFEEEEPAA